MSLFGNHFCDVNIGYWDEKLLDANCPGAFELLRHWVIRDECQPLVPGINPVEHIQSIKVEDVTPPTLLDGVDVTISTDLWGCSGTYELPDLLDGDNCSETETKWTYSDGFLVNNTLTGLSKGTTLVNAKVRDACGNYGIESFTITVLDQVPPVVVADQHTVVSLSQDDLDGRAKIFAETFDDGSFDGCGPVEFTVRRMDMDTLCSVGTHPGYAQFDGEFQWYDFVHFCCNDVNNDSLRVVFRVCDDANMDGEFGSTDDYCNTAMVTVDVQDKLPPIVNCPADMSIDCIDFNALGDLVNSGPLSYEDAIKVNALFGDPQAGATCDYEITQSLTGSEFCGNGLLQRTIVVTNTVNNLTNSCTQEIDVRLLDENTLTCDRISFPAGSREALANYSWCDPQDDVAPFVNTITVNNCEGGAFTDPIIDIDQLCTEAGINLTLDTFDFAGGGCKKILAHWEVIDQCVFQENYLYFNGDTYEINPFVSENGYFELYIEYDIFDDVPPVITCGPDLILGCDAFFAGPIEVDAVDNCTENEFLGVAWRLDIDADGTFDAEGEGSVTAAKAGLASGYFPLGVHEITWVVSDGCGNTGTERCILSIGQEDTKAPTPYCYDGIATAIMAENGEVEIWANDFNAGSFDDCDSILTLTMIPMQDVDLITGGSTAVYDAALASWTFDCSYIANGVQSIIDVRMYATDDAGNWDYCTASLRINDNFDVCEDIGGAGMIAGAISTEEGELVEGVAVEINTFSPEYPYSMTTDSSGEYAFNNNPFFYDYQINPNKDVDYKNGVTTLDLVIMQKHILAIDALDGPYKRIAADVNSDCRISASDLLHLRKLILGLYPDDDLPANESWRFVEKAHIFADPDKPCNYSENVELTDLATSFMNEDFIGVKIGDVNQSAEVNGRSNAEVRSDEYLNMTIDDQKIEKGKTYEVSFYCDNFTDVHGYQFTIGFETPMLKLLEIKSEALEVDASNFGLNRVEDGLIATSWNEATGMTVKPDAKLFTIVFEAKSNGEIADAISINSEIAKAESYSNDLSKVDDVRLNNRRTADTYVFELFQNRPNPFTKKTEIGFVIPEANRTTLTIYNAIGELLYEYEEDLPAGEHNVVLNREDLNGVGVLYYRLVSGDNNKMNKMIVVD
jgi:hypothetical protein